MAEKQPSECFWCGTVLIGARQTKDHFISRPVRNLTSLPRDKTCVSCAGCNFVRSQISDLFVLVKKRVAHEIHHPRSEFLVEAIKKQREQLRDEMVFFQDQISSKLEGDLREVCLKEIETIESWVLKQGAAA